MPSEYLKNSKGPMKPLATWPCFTSKTPGTSTPLDVLLLAPHTMPKEPARAERNENMIPAEKPKKSKNQSSSNRKLWRPFEVSCPHPQPHRAFRCFCGSAFARNEELTRHLRIHSGQRPFECNQCGRKFGRKDHRDKHLKTHLRNEYKRIHRCPVGHCPGRYTRTDALNRHMLATHGFRRPRKRTIQEGSAKDQEVSTLTSKPVMISPASLAPSASSVPQLPHLRSAQMIAAVQIAHQLHGERKLIQGSSAQARSVSQFQQELQGMIVRNEIYSRSPLPLMRATSAEQHLLWQRWL
ncbi:early growth response protein 1-like [Varroa destructor]|uniref:C2H2-type domain-containing protein n=1 Tax=Varroa destructor TaxID=109461 RepID=A0A7M7L4W9_VARDE|nr:early growth response protein 1-like [Varroa destructor]